MAEREFDYNRLWSGQSKDRAHTVNFSVFNGGIGISVFAAQKGGGGGGGGPLTRMSLLREDLITFMVVLQKVKKGSPGFNITIEKRDWDQATRQHYVVGTLVFGRDEDNVPYFTFQDQKVKSIQVPLRTSTKTTVSAIDGNADHDLAIDILTEIFRTDIPGASLRTKFKRDFNGGGKGGGGNRGGYGGGNRPQSGGGSSVADSDDEIMFLSAPNLSQLKLSPLVANDDSYRRVQDNMVMFHVS